jgi:hypothetical protein
LITGVIELRRKTAATRYNNGLMVRVGIQSL